MSIGVIVENKLILGGGASGLSSAVLLPNSIIIESSSKVGGLSNSKSIDGFTFDQGPHIMFSRDKEVLSVMVDSLRGNVHTCMRNNVVMINGSLVRYPIENDLSSLPANVRINALQDFLRMRISPISSEPKNLEEWFLRNFGETLTNIYFKPYNEKIWNLPFSEISMTWADRIPSPPWEDVLKGAMGVRTEGYVHQLYYDYPKKGGYESLMRSWSEQISSHRIRTNSKIQKIERVAENDFRITINGVQEDFSGDIISTIPLHTLIDIYVGTPEWVKDYVNSLPVNPLITVNLGFAKKDDNQFTAVYIPDTEFLVNRISFPGVFSPDNVPSENHLLIQAEITVTETSPAWFMTDDELIQHVLDGLKKRNLLSEFDQPIFEYVERIKDAYVVYPTDFEDRREKVIDFFRAEGIFLNGRFGSHNYLNVDGILIQSIELAKQFDSELDLVKIRNLFGL
jgi:protoporphyrinogen oxidase